MTQTTPEAPAPTTDRRPAHAAVAIAVGAVAALAALIPWMATGMRLPIQNLWATNAMPQGMPLVLLPLNNYYVAQLFALLITGAALAGAAVALARASARPLRAGLVLLGVLVVQVGALTHTAIVTLNGLDSSTRAHVYVAGLAGGAALTILVGIPVMLGIAHGKPATATLAIAVSAVAINIWLSSLVIAVLPDAMMLPEIVWRTLDWLPLVITGVAIGWCGVRTVARTLASIGAILIIWIGPALVTAVSYGLGSRVYFHFPAEMVAASKQVFGLSLGSTGHGPERIAVTVVTAILSWMFFAARARRTSAPPAD